METDPIAENQTNVMIAKLTTRSDGDVELNHAVAALLSSSQRQARELLEIKSSLWSPDALDRRIIDKHNNQCSMCSVRKWVETYREKIEADQKDTKKSPGLWTFLMSERGLLVIVVILFALMCARMMLGSDGYKDVTGTMHLDKPANGGTQGR